MMAKITLPNYIREAVMKAVPKMHWTSDDISMRSRMGNTFVSVTSSRGVHRMLGDTPAADGDPSGKFEIVLTDAEYATVELAASKEMSN